MLNARFLKALVWINGAVPGLLLAGDAYTNRLGANPVNDAIRTTGLVALVMLVLSLAVTPLRRLTGWNQLIATRRPLGLWGFYYACAHLALYVGLDRALNLSSTVSEVLSRRYLQVGFIAVLAMTPLALTSTDAMVRRLGAKRWKSLHRLAYVAVAAGVLHYYLLVKSDVRQPLAFAAVLGSLYAGRLGWHYRDLRVAAGRKPSAPSPAAAPRPKFWQGELRVARVFDETPDVRTFRLVPLGGGPLPFDHEPGQYLTLRQEIEGRPVVRCYTIASPPSRSHSCEITVKREPQGASSRWLHDRVRVGDRLRVGAPAGRFVFNGAGANHLVLIAGGVGITPLMAIARYLTDIGWGGKIDFLVAARTRESIIFYEELQSLERRFENFTLRMVLSHAEGDPDWTGERGHLTPELIRKWVPEIGGPPVYLCGPKPMMVAVAEQLRSLGVAERLILTEEFVSAAALASADRPEATSVIAAAPDSALASAASPREVAPREVAESIVLFSRSGVRTTIRGDQSVLEAAEEAGVSLPFECRSGVCGQCKVRLASGRVAMDAEDALSAAEKSRGYILACQAHALDELSVEA